MDLRGEGQERTVLVTSFNGEDDSRVIPDYGVHDVIVADLTITSSYGHIGEDPEDGNAGGGPMYGVYIGAQALEAAQAIEQGVKTSKSKNRDGFVTCCRWR